MKLGIAEYDGRRVICDEYRLDNKPKEVRAARWSRAREAYQEWVGKAGVRLVCYEKVSAHKGTAAAHCYGALEALLELRCAALNVPIFPVSVGELKVFATGKGNATKDMMIDAALAWDDYKGEVCVTDNEADAIHLARYGWERGLSKL